jgi:hypothetical protein
VSTLQELIMARLWALPVEEKDRIVLGGAGR